MSSIRIRWKIASKHAQIHGQNSRLSSENFRDVMQGITHCNFLVSLGNKAKGVAEVA